MGAMNIRVLGAGAVGSLLGALAAEAGHDVCFTDYAEPARLLAARGLRVVLPGGWLRLPKVRTSPPRRAPELTVVALKRAETRELLRSPLLPREGLRLVLNADPGDLQPPSEGLLPGYTLLTAVMLQPGEVELASRRSVVVLPRHPALREAAKAWKAGGLECVESEDLEATGASFFLWQLLFLPVALCHSTLDHFLADEAGRRIALGVLEEGLAVFRRLGLKLGRLPLEDPQELAQRLVRGRPADFAAGGELPDRACNSLLQSLLRGQKTEVRELNERLVRLAAGSDPRWNWRLIRKLSRVGQVGFFGSPGELLQALG